MRKYKLMVRLARKRTIDGGRGKVNGTISKETYHQQRRIKDNGTISKETYHQQAANKKIMV
ncbi:hypothetical protein FZC84_08410 [Rossellomorea vietnamensis]|uniref:Uncharacterized protein n=1 Tax=Rossellomorea vietnamensis TaxID=218284 RepID=A0A5D4MFP3_9BACI|nr:hypothetical protein [Rossellomorea vietnamensis]TYR99830.1 hypothetical protein FZC84_08410 [Rossellomorea vietnamensis]